MMDQPRDERPENDRSEAAERADHLRRLRSRVNELEQQLRQLQEQTAAEWSRFDEAQQTIPCKARLTHDDWYAKVWGPQISVLKVQLSNALTAWKLLQAHTPQEK
jgi:hypothetical protein